MLHSTLPRAYLGYHANYFEDAYAYPYYAAAAASPWANSPPPPATTTTTTTQQRDTASPLDLSLKRSISNDDIEVEVDDEEDRRARLLLLHCRQPSPDERSSCSSSTHSYHTTPRKSAELWYHPQEQQQSIVYTPQPMTPPSTPSPTTLQQQCSPPKKFKESPQLTTTPITPKISSSEKPPRAKKKHVRKLKFDEETSSPVSGTVILGPDEAVVTGDIDPAFNIVEVTEEARAELAKIENRLGPYQCKLCRQLHDDAFQLAQHRCSRIAHVEYRCPECDKRFSCPANLASHRRWHKPRPTVNDEFACTNCEAKFSKQAALRKHITSQHPNLEQNNNNNDGDKFVEGNTTAALAMELA